MLLLKAYGLAIWEWLFGTGTIFAKLLQEHSWICHITRGFATRDMTNSLVLLQKLCKNCPRPEKLHLQQWSVIYYRVELWCWFPEKSCQMFGKKWLKLSHALCFIVVLVWSFFSPLKQISYLKKHIHLLARQIDVQSFLWLVPVRLRCCWNKREGSFDFFPFFV